MLLRRAMTTSAVAAAGSILLLGFALLGPAMPEAVAWTIAYACVALATISVLAFGWIVLTLPPGAPIRTRGLRAGGAFAALTLAIMVLRTGMAG